MLTLGMAFLMASMVDGWVFATHEECTYTERFRSSLIALISIFLLPMMATASGLDRDEQNSRFDKGPERVDQTVSV